MRRMLIDDRIKDLAKRYSQEVFKKHHNSQFTYPKERLNTLYNYIREKQKDNFEQMVDLAQYVWEIKLNYEEILVLQPQDFLLYDSMHFDYVSDQDLKTSITISDADSKKYNLPSGSKKFYEAVVWAMRYEDLRDKDFLFYMDELRIHACVYCNAQYAVTLKDVKDENEKEQERVAMYQLDHFMPKSKYPFLSTSFFNLQPCCANCNVHKSDKPSLFNLYTDRKEDLEPLYFDITPNVGIVGVDSYDLNNLEIHLHSNNKALETNHKHLFLIDDVYKYHKHEAQETIVRLRINDHYYRRQLQEGLRTLFPDGVESPERFYWGHEIDADQVHYRPLNKLVQDIVKYVTNK